MRRAVLALLLLGAAPAAALTFNVTTVVDGDDGSCDAQCTLREAVRAANARPGPDAIALPDGVYGLTRTGAREDAAARGDLDVTDDLSIAGAGARTCILDGLGADRLLHVHNVRLELRRLSLRGGAARGEYGGALAVFGGGVLLVDVEVAASATDSRGGGIYAGASDLRLERSTVAGNAAGEGGGIYFQGFTRRLDVVTSTISGNRAARGGGVFVDLECGFERACALVDTTVAANQAAADAGGGLASLAGADSLRLAGTLLADNGGGNCAARSAVSAGDNLADDASCALAATGDQNGAAVVIGPLGWNGGATRTHLPLPGGAAIDVRGACGDVDQRGRRRDAACDAGAVEASRGTCGDGFVDRGEACDPSLDGGGCCDAACGAAPEGSACADDGDPCSANRCDAGGHCAHLPAAAPSCRAARRARLAIRSGAGLDWIWSSPDAVSAAIPSQGALCAYAADASFASAIAVGPQRRRGGPWAARPGERHAWSQDQRAASPLDLVRVEPAADGSRLRVVARPMGLPLAGVPLPLRLQWRTANGGCWESVFDSRSVTRNDAAALRAAR